MPELISYCYKNYLDVRKNGCGNCGVSGPVDCNCLCELVVGRHCHCPNFHFHDNQRHQNVYLHITHTKYCPLPEHFYAKPWLQLKENRVSEWVVPLLQSNGSKNRGSWPVCLFVTWDPSVLHQAVNNLEAKNEPDQLTNACAGRHVRKRKKT